MNFRKVIQAIANGIGKLTSFFAILAQAALALIILMVFHEVVARYVFTKPTVFSVEISEYLLVFSAFMSAGWILQKDRHVSMEVVYSLLPKKIRLILDIITSLVVMLFCVILTWKGWTTVEMAYLGEYHSSSEVNAPLWIPYAFIPIGALMLGLQFIVRVGERLRMLIELEKQQ